MLSNVHLKFVQSVESPSDADAPDDVAASPFSGGGVERVDFQAALSELFELKIIQNAKEDDVDPTQVVGKYAEVEFGDQAFCARARGIVRRLRQLTSEPTGLSRYELTVVPPLWLTTQRTNSRIFQNQTVEQIVTTIGQETLGKAFLPPTFDLAAGMPAAREYRVQYDETDYKFVCRILAEEGLVFFFDEKGKWTIVDDTTEKAALMTVSSTRQEMQSFKGDAIPFRPIQGHATEPHVANVASSVSIAKTVVVLRDYDYTRPPHDADPLEPLETKYTEPDSIDPTTGLETYRYEIDKLTTDAVASARAKDESRAERAMAQSFRCDTTFTVWPGRTFQMVDHPRAALNKPMLVVRMTISLYDTEERRSVLDCIPKSIPWLPPYIPKPRIFGTQTGFVVTSSVDEEILGRREGARAGLLSVGPPQQVHR